MKYVNIILTTLALVFWFSSKSLSQWVQTSDPSDKGEIYTGDYLGKTFYKK